MSAPHNSRIVQRAKEMWTEEGLSPQQSIDQLKYEVDNNLLNVPKGTDVPADKSSINRWAKAGNWKPHWRDVLAAKNEPASQEEMTVVEQVLYHLSENRGFIKARDYAYHPDFRTSSTEQVLMAIQMDLSHAYNPPPVVFRALKPKLRARIRREKNSAAVVDKASKESDGTLQEIIHSPTGEIVRIVKALEEDEEAPLLDGAYRIISASMTDQILKPPEEQEESEE